MDPTKALPTFALSHSTSTALTSPIPSPPIPKTHSFLLQGSERCFPGAAVTAPTHRFWRRRGILWAPKEKAEGLCNLGSAGPQLFP